MDLRSNAGGFLRGNTIHKACDAMNDMLSRQEWLDFELSSSIWSRLATLSVSAQNHDFAGSACSHDELEKRRKSNCSALIVTRVTSTSSFPPTVIPSVSNDGQI